MSNIDNPTTISTPSRPRYSLNPKRSGTFTTEAPNVAGFSPGGKVFEGYSYLTRSTSMSTSTRSRPKGLQSRASDINIHTTSPLGAKRDPPSSPSSPPIPRVSASPHGSPFSHTLDLPKRRSTVHRMPTSHTMPDLCNIPSHTAHSPRSISESERLAEAVANLPHNPKFWLPSQVALYLTHVLGLVPRPVVEDVTAYVRSSRMGGRAFLRLSEKDLERQGLNLKWRKLMVEAGKKLRRDALRGRIWGYESASMRWPKSSFDLEREEADEEEEEEQGLSPQDDEDGEQGIVKASKTTSKLTLKRMRDSRKVRGMIDAFQATTPTPEPISLQPVEAPFGHGYVRDQAQHILSEAEQKKLSLRRPLRPRRSTADFPWLEQHAGAGGNKREDVEAMLSSLTATEAEELANELGLVDLMDSEAVSRALGESDEKHHRQHERSTESADEVTLMPTLMRHDSADSVSVEDDTSVSECSCTESELEFDEAARGHQPRYSVLDENVIRAIMFEEDFTPSGTLDSEYAAGREEYSRNDGLTRSHTTASIMRPTRPYRASLYTDDELAALDRSSELIHARTESSRELVGLASDIPHDHSMVAAPEFGTARLRTTEETTPTIPTFDQTSPVPVPELLAAQNDYIFNPSEISPINTIGSTRGAPSASRKATFGSKRGKAVLSLLANPPTDNMDLFASLPGATMLRNKSSGDEDGWGGTLGSMRGSRKGLSGVFDCSMQKDTIRKSRVALTRVASEAEAEAVCAQLDQVEANAQKEEKAVEVSTDRYEETTLSETEDDSGLERRASVEQRLSKLFLEGQADESSLSTESNAEPSTNIKTEKGKIDVEQDVKAEAQPVAEQPASIEPEAVPEAPQELGLVAQVEPVATETLVTEAEERGKLPAVSELPAVEATRKPEAIDTVQDLPSANLSERKPLVDLPTDTIVSENHAIPVPNDQPLPSLDTTATAVADADLNTYTATPTADTIKDTIKDTSEEAFELIKTPLSPSLLPSSDVNPFTENRNQEKPTAAAQMLVPLTVLEPHPSGTGSIKKRSMVLVDRKRFESLARRMGDLEAELDRVASSCTQTIGSNVGFGSRSELKNMFSRTEFEGEHEEEELEEGEEDRILDGILAVGVNVDQHVQQSQVAIVESMEVEEQEQEQKTRSSGGGWLSYLSPTGWANYLSSLNPYYAQSSNNPATTITSPTLCSSAEEDELSLYALLGRPESEYERHLLSIGAIPAYMLGLGAGVGFVLVREVLGKGFRG
ncbi:uncharacterized protein MEPE_03656 [Melanopsichium pennsylvanicum]|uniref:SAM domain-containing protein n=2 Tax=Melanopsichium pennsylvanicum TaxID=63383 RepID=A0AAJ5C5P1_9BASI|nr:putative protein [Melanopsichium pennsylvanicum 4]SNX84947.1 uncharacterized protein MEPE_03656 [Melanopsichium pennsylvanicum]